LLTARTKTGKKICLGYNYKRETLLYLRRTEEFVCPVCGEKVTLKLGDQRIYHFAHQKGTECRDFYEPESLYHMDGKLQLYQWLLNQRVKATLEYYDKEIQQRPDIMFYFKGKKFALEYQCSPIPENIFLKRTKSYKENGYIPIWILGNKHVHQKKKNMVSLSNFQYSFIRSSTERNYYLPAYCPEKRKLHFLNSIYTYSSKNSLINNTYFNIDKLKVDDLLNPKVFNEISIVDWYHELDYFFLNWSLHPSRLQQCFLHELYTNNLNPYLLPPEIGLPIQSSFFIQTSPIIWQTYFYLDMLAGKAPGDVFGVFEIQKGLLNRIKRGEIIVRELPQFSEIEPLICILHYLEKLTQLGFITPINEELFQIEHLFKIPSTNREKEESRKTFYKKFQLGANKIINQNK
jgi:competence protein CoiA